MIVKLKTIDSSVVEFDSTKSQRLKKGSETRSTRLLDDIDFVKRGAGATPLLKREEERLLARQTNQ